MNQSRSSPEGDHTLQSPRLLNSQGGIAFQNWSTVPPELQPAWVSDEAKIEKTPKEMIRESEMLEKLIKHYSQASPQVGSAPVPRIEFLRRSPVSLISSISEPPKKDLRGFVPELNIPLDHVKHLSDGVLEFGQVVRNLCAERVILEEFRRGECLNSRRVVYKNNDFTKKAGLEREKNILSFYDLIQDSWSYTDNANPYPTLDPILVKPQHCVTAATSDWNSFSGSNRGC
ncbi:hypothetical protein N431DRAFT_512569 [Stipitochalara longipes BDJ]|nr:hypothetical protein N431DRAFT_512569 [Stipitochalara longipes BDJ]